MNLSATIYDKRMKDGIKQLYAGDHLKHNLNTRKVGRPLKGWADNLRKQAGRRWVQIHIAENTGVKRKGEKDGC